MLRFIVIGLLLATSLSASARDLDAILDSGTLRVGTTGDYKPFTYLDEGEYEGFDIDMAEYLAKEMGLEVEFVETSWPTLMDDLKADEYDIGMGGISRTISRQLQARYSHPYLTYGKTPLVHVDSADRFSSLEDIDQPDVRIGVNPGGTNEAFVKGNIQQAEVVVIEHNLDIPPAVAAKEVDVMITDSPEAIFYANADENLAAPLADEPFTKSQLAYLIQADAERLQDTVNFILERMELTGDLDALRREHMLIQ
ncbi:cyclohexadienyl dehydratase [Litchfieldella qijiaojingensis]|uniref:Cyclohexadienyl dehydratase n=1 Tax=Litchfieldella qijiaojingensis TaxID=980347 RepID=A0ABQ2Z0I9_9GAMM|nr:transporter substrate-binding domain-containing protein [Halomonas qijiaojingensis]GGX99914.1 cyclohexadienyl dehydratase [Halomonas qijiaojingensis]